MPRARVAPPARPTAGELPLLALPGGPYEGIVSGVTPPYDPEGRPIELSQVRQHLPLLQALAGGGEWTVRWSSQVHGSEVVAVNAASRDEWTPPEADALVTSRPAVLLVTRHADCPPVLLWDPVKRALGLVHS
ncbi:MAG: laccase domain-containing protein, partial [Chloroflexota bacterium]|nr:laccase domain-containing protein [Chloroflexota bacterium]